MSYVKIGILGRDLIERTGGVYPKQSIRVAENTGIYKCPNCGESFCTLENSDMKHTSIGTLALLVVLLSKQVLLPRA